MEQRPDRYTVIIDANVLTGALLQDTILWLAYADLFRPRWTDRILSEVDRVLLDKFDLPAEKVEKLRSTMGEAFPEACVEGWEDFEGAFGDLPDPDDRHVVAAAIKCDAGSIVTSNLKDFPASVLSRFGIEAVSPDAFIADVIDLDPATAVAALRTMREGFRWPEMTAEALIGRYEALDLKQTAGLLVPYIDKL